ncbi:hypothetical protein P154DRAFT_538556 [Amniculicola lignicola CBS 123094]|uniref:Apple domain-containing protein n=1 Tax=Amniculicola lignicola CBS 123094 TaxID=1392246 RepID=A0A6A5WDH7_9PLEO|nr:hypothetical protein P154DRAFT_538556 [Amniculicola lignicola CBS 123094]
MKRSIQVLLAAALAGSAFASTIPAQKRNTCLPRNQLGTAPLPPVDNEESFNNWPVYSDISQTAVDPQGYVQAFQNYNASVIYTGHHIDSFSMEVYNTELCARQCDTHYSGACKAFNIFIERLPDKEPGAACPNPPATAVYQCTIWGEPIYPELASNIGQSQGPKDKDGKDFAVRIRASNGYNRNFEGIRKVYAPIDGFEGPFALPAAINTSVAMVSGQDHINTHYFNGEYNAAKCASLCDAHNEESKATAEEECAENPSSEFCWYKPCNYFNVYNQAQNNNPDGYYCSLFTNEIPASEATVFNIKSKDRTWAADKSRAYVRDPMVPGYIRAPSTPNTSLPLDLPANLTHAIPTIGIQRFLDTTSPTAHATITKLALATTTQTVVQVETQIIPTTVTETHVQILTAPVRTEKVTQTRTQTVFTNTVSTMTTTTYVHIVVPTGFKLVPEEGEEHGGVEY